MTNAAYYKVSHSSHGFELVLEHGDGEATLIGYFPTRAEANATKAALVSLRKGR